MEHAEEYEILTTENGTLVFIIQPRKNEPTSPRLIYDGGNHATYYHTPSDIILMDYINPKIFGQLAAAQEVLFIELDYDKEKVIRDFKVPVLVVKKNPFTDNLE